MTKAISCSLTGDDGNAILVRARVIKALQRAGAEREVISEYRANALKGNYDEMIQLSMGVLERAGISYE